MGSGFRRLAAAVLIAALATQTGCVGLTSQIIYWIKGNNIEAEYKGLQQKRVAVVCAMPNQTNDSDGVPQRVALKVGLLLAENVKKIKVVPQKDVQDWINRNEWDQIDYKSVGRGVKADMIVEIKLTKFTVNEGSAFLKGRADAAVNVYDMSKGGELVFSKDTIHFEFPRDGVRSLTETTEAEFRAVVVGMLTEKVAKTFYAYDKVEDFANDARFLNTGSSQ